MERIQFLFRSMHSDALYVSLFVVLKKSYVAISLFFMTKKLNHKMKCAKRNSVFYGIRKKIPSFFLEIRISVSKLY